jgi:hypothetical protein
MPGSMRRIVEIYVFFYFKVRIFCDGKGTLTRAKNGSIRAAIMMARDGIRSVCQEMKRPTGNLYIMTIFVMDRMIK